MLYERGEDGGKMWRGAAAVGGTGGGVRRVVLVRARRTSARAKRVRTERERACGATARRRPELPRWGLRRGAHGQAPGWPIKNATPAVHTAALNQQSEPPGIKPHTATASKEWKAAKAYSIASIAIDE